MFCRMSWQSSSRKDPSPLSLSLSQPFSPWSMLEEGVSFLVAEN